MNIDAIHKSGKKLISFIIPCYHSEGSVGLVIDEIRQVVAQRPDFTYQIIAVNDCSPDNLLAVIRAKAERAIELSFRRELLENTKNRTTHQK